MRKTTKYFEAVMQRPDRARIEMAWIERVVESPERTETQKDGRIRKWAAIPEMGGRYLRVILLYDSETLHDAFFDRGFKP